MPIPVRRPTRRPARHHRRTYDRPKLQHEPLEPRHLLALGTPFTFMWAENVEVTEPQESYIFAESEINGTITSERISRGDYRVNFEGLATAVGDSYGDRAALCADGYRAETIVDCAA